VKTDKYISASKQIHKLRMLDNIKLTGLVSTGNFKVVNSSNFKL